MQNTSRIEYHYHIDDTFLLQENEPINYSKPEKESKFCEIAGNQQNLHRAVNSLNDNVLRAIIIAACLSRIEVNDSLIARTLAALTGGTVTIDYQYIKEIKDRIPIICDLSNNPGCLCRIVNVDYVYRWCVEYCACMRRYKIAQDTAYVVDVVHYKDSVLCYYCTDGCGVIVNPAAYLTSDSALGLYLVNLGDFISAKQHHATVMLEYKLIESICRSYNALSQLELVISRLNKQGIVFIVLPLLPSCRSILRPLNDSMNEVITTSLSANSEDPSLKDPYMIAAAVLKNFKRIVGQLFRPQSKLEIVNTYRNSGLFGQDDADSMTSIIVANVDNSTKCRFVICMNEEELQVVLQVLDHHADMAIAANDNETALFISNSIASLFRQAVDHVNVLATDVLKLFMEECVPISYYVSDLIM